MMLFSSLATYWFLRSPITSINHSGVEDLSVFGMVINGSAYDRAVLPVSEAGVYVFPDDAIIVIDENISEIEIFIRKTLGHHGHPGHQLTILDAREYMGMAYRIDDGECVLATYGEWASIEGGACINILFKMPPRVSYTTRGNLSGPDSEACGDWVFDHNENRVLWATGTKPREDWEKINTEIDLEMTPKSILNKY